MDARDGGENVLGGLHAGVAFSDDHDALVAVFLRVSGDLGVRLAVLDAGYIRCVRHGVSGGDDDAFCLDLALVGESEDESSVSFPANRVHPGAFGDVEVEVFAEVAQVFDERVCRGKVVVGIRGEEVIQLFGEQGVPIPPEVLVLIVKARVDLVVRDELSVTRKLGEEVSYFVGVEDDVVVSSLFEEVCQLKAGWPSANDDVVAYAHVLPELSRLSMRMCRELWR